MRILIDILAYAVLTGFDFAALCRMTKVGRGWVAQLFALGVLVALNAAVELMWRAVPSVLPVEHWLTLLFLAREGAVAAFVLLLSRESVGRRIFLAITWLAYATCYSVICAAFAYRAVGGGGGYGILGLSYVWANVVSLVVLSVLNLVFLFWLFPLLPRDTRAVRWGVPCLNAVLIFAILFVSGVWPVSVCVAPSRYCVPFMLAFISAWIGFPFLCRAMRAHFQHASVRHSLELMTNEVVARRAAIEEARRMNHDRRHDRIVVTDLLLRGNVEKALAYLRETGGADGPLTAAAHVWCEHETLNAILAGAARKAAAKGVALRAEAHVGRALPLSDVELVAVVANLVENAINACEKVKVEGQGQQRSNISDSSEPHKDQEPPLSTFTSNLDLTSVVVTLRQRGELFGLTVVNPVPPGFRLSPAGLPCSEPGIGLGSVREVVRRYRGEWQYTLENGSLVCELAVGAGGAT